MGLDWSLQITAIIVPHVIAYTTWLDRLGEGGALGTMSPAAYLVQLAGPRGNPVAGENAAGGGPAQMLAAVAPVRALGLAGMMWMSQVTLLAGDPSLLFYSAARRAAWESGSVIGWRRRGWGEIWGHVFISPASVDALFSLPPATAPGPDRRPVAKTVRPYDPHQLVLLPPSPDDWLPDGHLARFVSELVEEALDLAAIRAAYTEERGLAPYDPRLMLKLLLYGYTTGCRSSRAIERRCVDDVGFRSLAAGAGPDYRSIARFRQRHAAALAGLFLQSLRLCQAAGMVKLGQVALDGTKLRANASRHQAMSYGRMVKREAELTAEVAALLADAERVDAADDARLGPDQRDDDLPGELARRDVRLAKIRAAKAALEAEARAAATAAARTRAAARGGDAEAVNAAGAAAGATAVPAATAQRNFTDPASRIMKMNDGAFHQAYNGQAAVDAAHQVIVAAAVTPCAADTPSLVPMLAAITENGGRPPRQLLADAGYCSDANLDAVGGGTTRALIATGRLPHGQAPPPAPWGRIPRAATAKDRMARPLRTKAGRAAYGRRKAIVEPVFGQLHTLQHARWLLLRGLAGAALEWQLLCAGHNLRKLHQVRGGSSRRGLAPA